MKVTVNKVETKALSTGDMKIGDVGALLGSKEVILKHYGGLVSLSNPANNWGLGIELDVIRIYPKGTKIEMEVE